MGGAAWSGLLALRAVPTVRAMKRFALVASLATFALAATLAGCRSPRVPLTLDPALRPMEVGTIVVLPVLDGRPDPLERVRVAAHAQEAMVRLLRERGYVAIGADQWRRTPDEVIDPHVEQKRPDELLDPRTVTAGQLLPLVPEDGEWFLLVRVERLEPSYESNQVWDARLAAAMVDRAKGEVVWRDVATASGNWSGALTFLGRGSVQYDAVQSASRSLVQTLPDRKELTKQRARTQR